jgi:Fur family transcriptional regulator, ferric uptake regulator
MRNAIGKPKTSQAAYSAAELADRLRSIGQRATPQRLLILGAFERPHEHLTAEEVYARVGPLAPAINRSTVYRTLELFRDIGVVTETDLGGEARYYELLDLERHHHLVCQECEAILELSDDLVEPLRSAIATRYGFDAQIDHLALFGRCAHCRQSAETAHGASSAGHGSTVGRGKG